MAQSVRDQTQYADARLNPPSDLTYEQFLVWADGLHAEWVDGEVFLMTPVTNRHQQIALFLIQLFQEFAEAHDLGTVLFAPFQMRLTATRSGREPDVLFLARRHQERLTETFLDGPADIVVEIVSPESRERDRVVKLAEYAQGGVPEYWLIDPDRQEAIFYCLDSEGVYQARTAEANGVYACVAVPPLWIQVSWLWEYPLPPMRSVRATLGLI